ncbi:MAG: phosphogluconate dehydrogenase (NAD(+)-dependent, decarboxylating) [Candidatus Woesebacteria bacterium]
MTIGYIGLGKMGKNMVFRLLEQHIDVIAWNRSPEPVEEVVLAGAKKAVDLSHLISQLPTPHVIWLMLPAGQVTDDFLTELLPLLTEGDLVIDGANSLYTDTLRRAHMFKEKGIRFMDVAVSGGPGGARNGACLMVGGEDNDFKQVESLLKSIAAPLAYAHVGPTGAGHFAKMVHNGIEYGMMEAIAEGAAVLEKSDFHFDLAEVFRIYNTRSVIESRLVAWTQEALAENPTLTGVSPVIAHSGEGEWTVNAAKELGIPIPIIEESLNVRKNSANDGDSFRNKVVTAQRGKFGGHSTK